MNHIQSAAYKHSICYIQLIIPIALSQAYYSNYNECYFLYLLTNMYLAMCSIPISHKANSSITTNNLLHTTNYPCCTITSL